MQRSATIIPNGSALTRLRTWSAQTLRAKYYAFVNGTDEYPAGDWRICLDRSRAPIDRCTATGADVPVCNRTAFIEFWRMLGETNQQDWSAAYNELIHIWNTTYGFAHFGNETQVKRYTSIPGYSTWPKALNGADHLDGWSYSNLMRHVSCDYDQAAARIGYSKAAMLRIPVLTDRTKIEFGQFVEFDDHEFNSKNLFQRKPMRPLSFGATEVFTADLPLIGCRPTVWDYEEEVKRKLTEREFMWFVVAYLTDIGYRADIGTELIVERGTAAIRGDNQNRPITDPNRVDFEKRIWDSTAGKVTVYRGGRHGQPAHDGQFRGRSKGNFKTKALIEGAWAIVDNEMASLPGQVGRNRDHSPEQLHGQEQYVAQTFRQIDALAKAGTPLDDAQLNMLQFPFPPFWQWREQMLQAIHRIRTSRRHDLQGWEKLGFVQPVWRLPSVGTTSTSSPLSTTWLPWQKFLALPEQQQAAVKAMLDADPSLVSELRLSRHEAFEQHRHLLTKVPLEMVPSLVGRENALSKPVRVMQGLFTFECAEIDPDPLRFYARKGKDALANGDYYSRYAARNIALVEDYNFFTGTGAGSGQNGSVAGLTSSTITNTKVLQMATTKTHYSDATLANMRALRAVCDAAALRNGAYYLHPSFEQLLSGLNTSGDKPYVANGLNGAQLDGFPIKWIDVMPVYSTAANVSKVFALFGDMSFQYLGVRGGIRFDTSVDAAFTTDEILIRALERFTIGLMANGAVAGLETAAS